MKRGYYYFKTTADPDYVRRGPDDSDVALAFAPIVGAILGIILLAIFG